MKVGLCVFVLYEGDIPIVVCDLLVSRVTVFVCARYSSYSSIDAVQRRLVKTTTAFLFDSRVSAFITTFM